MRYATDSPWQPTHLLPKGDHQGFSGASAVAPLRAGLIALINQSLGTWAGFVNMLLYSWAQGSIGEAAGAFHDITQGDNKVGPNGVGYSVTVG